MSPARLDTTPGAAVEDPPVGGTIGEERSAEPSLQVGDHGGRRCIGAAFAQMEMRVALRTILDHVDWEPATHRPERQVDLHVSIVPARGARIRRTA